MHPASEIISSVREMTGLSESALYRAVSAKTFPAPLKLGPKSNRWIRQEIEAWFAARLSERESA